VRGDRLRLTIAKIQLRVCRMSPLRDRHAALNGFGRRAICQIDWKIRCGAVFYRGDKPTTPTAGRP
jgi:hypothetical protein